MSTDRKKKELSYALSFKSRKPSGRTTSIRRATGSIRVQISSARGISNSPCRVSTTSSGVPATSSPVIWTSLTVPTSAGAVAMEQGEEETTGGSTGLSNTEQPTKSDTKYFPAGSVTRCSNGISTSSPRNFSASGIEAQPSKWNTPCPGWFRSIQNAFSPARRGSAFPALSPRNTSFIVAIRSGKSVSSSAATSPLFPRGRSTRASATQRCVSPLNLPVSQA